MTGYRLTQDDVDFFAALKGDGEACVIVQIEQLQGRGFDGSDKNVYHAGGKLPQCGGALLLHVRMRREVFKGKHIVGGKTHHSGGIDGPGQLASGLEKRFKRLGGLIVGNNHHNRLLSSAGHQRQVERSRRRGQSGHTSSPRTQAEVPAYAFKARSLLQLREGLADKRQDHQVQV